MTQLPNRLPETFREEKLELSNLNLNFVEGGTGQPVVFLHAYSDSWYSFRLVLPLLMSHFRCLVLDQRGHGGSTYTGNDFTMDAYTEDVIEFLNRKEIERASIVGSSMGSLIARKVALRCPEMVERLVFVGSGLRTDNNKPLIGLKAILEQLPEAIPREFVEALLAPNTERGNVPEWFFNARVDVGSQIAGKVWRKALDGILSDNHSDELGKITQRSLILGGQQDDIFSPAEQEQLAQTIPHAHIKLYENVGHYPIWECPKQFTEDLVNFLNS
jgi:non-heme chloroperoxidase